MLHYDALGEQIHLDLPLQRTVPQPQELAAGYYEVLIRKLPGRVLLKHIIVDGFDPEQGDRQWQVEQRFGAHPDDEEFVMTRVHRERHEAVEQLPFETAGNLRVRYPRSEMVSDYEAHAA